MTDRTASLNAAVQRAQAFLNTVDERPVAARIDAAGVHEALGGPVPEHGEDPQLSSTHWWPAPTRVWLPAQGHATSASSLAVHCQQR